ncbi:glycine betaine ABC transporter substrate-binding protein [Roseibium sp. Sym1]|uniref:glycine betaine ABC transporter substrate-binding protein n=1 Tax=Roseibium sp. Sym1 TaxID=3016006 RepID=UPI0022B33541|nr:glycine betaine ABC transporter substrate-binding protein [Roseibium sp. Sym1]
MKKLFVSVMVAAMTGLASPAMAEDCGTITVAEMNWASAGAIAQIDRIILENGYSCDVELVSGDTIPTFTSMTEDGEPDMAPELWINGVREPLGQAVADGSLIMGGKVLSEGGVEGFWVPSYLAEKHDIRTVDDALAHPELFPGAEDEGKGALHTCPVGWSCRTATRNQFRAYDGAEKGFVLVDPGSAAGLDESLARAYERKQGWLGYYWGPTALLGKYDMTLLDFGVPHDKREWDSCTVIADCADPKRNAWDKSEVFTVVTDAFAQKAGVAMDYVMSRSWDNRTAGKVMAWMEDNKATNEDGAYYFLENFEDVWGRWVSPEVAEKVKAAF